MHAQPIDAEWIDASLARDLIAAQFPQWAGLPVRPMLPGGSDHRLFRLGDHLCVRLPSAPGYVPQVPKEQEWLPRLSGSLPQPIPEVEGIGTPTEAFPAPWSVYGWMPGTPASAASDLDLVRLADDLAAFLVALRGVDAAGGPEPGLHSAYRGGPVAHWDDEVRDLLRRVDGRERATARAIWRDAVSAPFVGAPVWVHGDVSLNNLLVRDGALCGVVDFGCAAVGDPACDTVVRWSVFTGDARALFVEAYGVDEATWARGRGWALWKALIMLTNKPPGQAAFARHVLDELLAER